MNEPRPTIRVDKWLWYARFFKTRGLASKTVTGGHLRVNSNRVTKASHSVGANDTLTFSQGDRIRVVQILDIGTRRGPAPEAQTLYDDLTPAPPKAEPPKPRVGPAPSKKERRVAAKLKSFDLE